MNANGGVAKEAARLNRDLKDSQLPIVAKKAAGSLLSAGFIS